MRRNGQTQRSLRDPCGTLESELLGFKELESSVRPTKSVVFLALLTAAAYAVGQASAASPAKTFLRCSVHAHMTAGISTSGTYVGSVRCGHRFGEGGYHGRYREKVEPTPVIALETGSSKLSLKVGTVRGTYLLGPAPISGTEPFHGTFHITGGTGRFKHLNGTLNVTCAHRIPPLTDCTLSGSVTGI